jgi:Lar family restriction alleviation protein
MSDLKPCPFCGGKAVVNEGQTPWLRTFVECFDCHVCTCVYYKKDGKSPTYRAIAAWNRRVNEVSHEP